VDFFPQAPAQLHTLSYAARAAACWPSPLCAASCSRPLALPLLPSSPPITRACLSSYSYLDSITQAAHRTQLAVSPRKAARRATLRQPSSRAFCAQPCFVRGSTAPVLRCAESFIHCLTHSLFLSLFLSLEQSLNQSLTHSLTHSVDRSINQS